MKIKVDQDVLTINFCYKLQETKNYSDLHWELLQILASYKQKSRFVPTFFHVHYLCQVCFLDKKYAKSFYFSSDR